jgi:hypothetical protein
LMEWSNQSIPDAASLECSSVCLTDVSGKIVREGKVASEPEAWDRLSERETRHAAARLDYGFCTNSTHPTF